MATSGNDKLRGSDSADYLRGFAGNDTIWGYEGSDTLVGGKGNDSLLGGEDDDTFVYALGDGNDTIVDYNEEDKIQFTSGTPTFSRKGNDVVISVGSGSNKGSITVKNVVKNGKVETPITWLDADGVEHTYPEIVTLTRSGATLLSGYEDDSFDINTYGVDYSNVVTIDASAVNHDIEITGNKKNNKIIGGEGNDTIYSGSGNDTIWGGDGDDVYAFTGAAQGKNIIADYEMGDVIKITSGTVSSAAIVGKNYVFTVNSGSKSTTITVKDAKNKYVQVEDSTGTKTWYPEDPIPDGTYYAGGTLYLLKGYRGDEFDVVQFGSDFAGKVYTINASEVTHEIYITGNKYGNTIIGSGHDDTIDSGAGADYIDGGKGNDILIGGSGKDTFAFNKDEGNDKILDYEEGKDVVLLNGDLTLSSKKTVGKNVILTLSDNSTVAVVGAAGKKVSLVGEDPDPDISFNSKGTSATLLAGYDGNTFDVVGDSTWSNYASKLISINAAAVTHSLNITANKKSNYILGTFQKDTISAGAGADTIIGGAGNDILTGGDGADIFSYSKGDGSDRITDYDEEDVISINGVEVKSITTSKNGNDYIFTLTDKSKITVDGAAAAGKTITYSVDSDTFTYPEVPFTFNDDFTAVTLTSGYSKKSFTSADYGSFVDTLATIDASRVTHDITIIGSDLANKIIGSEEDDTINGGAGKDTLYGGDGNDSLYGGAGNDKLYGGDGRNSLWGGRGSDTLYGGSDKDTFIYSLGDGSDVIENFAAGEKIIVLSGEVRSCRASGGNVTFNIGSGSNAGSIIVKGAADQYVGLYDGSGNRIFDYNPNDD